MSTRDGIQRLIAREEARLGDLERDREASSARLSELRARLDDRPEAGGLTPQAKVAIFRRLFAGRVDVFPVRWENLRTGRTGYAPRCRNEWVHGVCAKPRVRCGECQHQAFVPVDDDVIRQHLQGRVVAGVYPLLPDDTCWFCAIDLDGASWAADARTIRESACDLGVPVAIERSRSGDGAHVWIFFAEPVGDAAARQLASAVLTEAGGRRASIGLSSYDRLFPSQDVLPRGGFGNLIALPLQWEARQSGCSVFLDDALEPFADQWGFLNGVERLDAARVNRLVGAAARRLAGVLGVADETQEPDEPWRLRREQELPIGVPPPGEVRVVHAQQVYVERDDLPPWLYDRMRRLAAFANPVFYERQRLRLPTGRVPRVIACAEEHSRHLALPRGCLDDLRALLERHEVSLVIDDQRHHGVPISAGFLGTLSPEQAGAVAALAEHETGVLVAPPGSGKTVMAMALIAQRSTSTLVIVPTRELVEQWRARLAAFLDLADGSIGVIAGGGRRPTGTIDVATVQSLVRRDVVDGIVAEYGHLVVDECHHVPSVSTERLLRATPARFVLGLTATPSRRDGHQPIIRMQCGPTRHTMRTRPDLTLRMITRTTRFRHDAYSPDVGIQELYRLLGEDRERNAMIVGDAVEALAEGRSPIILTARRDHLDRLAELLAPRVEQLCVLHGGLRPALRRTALETLADAKRPPLILATGRYLGEGFDHPTLDTLLLALPIAWKGTLTQYAGRLSRAAEGKRDARIYDYADTRVPVLARMYAKRERVYRSLGYEFGAMLEASHDEDPEGSATFMWALPP